MWRWRSYEEVYWGRMALCHSGVKGQKKGVRRYQNPDGTYTELGKERRRLEYSRQKRIIRKMDVGHGGSRPKGIPNSIVDHQRNDGKIDKRSFYDEDGMKNLEIHTTDHGNPKEHPFGKHGEHVHEYAWDENGRMVKNERRELTKTERRKNGDIL